MKIRHALILSAAFSGAFLSTSCSTTRGFGQDLQKVGERIEDRAEATGGAMPEQRPAGTMTPPPVPGPVGY